MGEGVCTFRTLPVCRFKNVPVCTGTTHSVRVGGSGQIISRRAITLCVCVPPHGENTAVHRARRRPPKMSKNKRRLRGCWYSP